MISVPIPAIVLLVVVLLLLFVGVPAWFTWAKRNWVWPKGDRFKGSFKGHTCYLILSPAADADMGLKGGEAEALAEAGARAAWAVSTAYGHAPLNPKHSVKKRLSEVVLCIRTDVEFDGEPGSYGYELRSGWNGVLLKVGKRVSGDSMPMAVTRTKFKDGILASGSITVHEWVHEVALDTPNDGVPHGDNKHEDPRLWEPHEGSLEDRARKLYIISTKE